MSKTNLIPSHIEIVETVLARVVEEATKAGMDVDKIVNTVRTNIEQSMQENQLAEILDSYPEWMQWQGQVGLD